MSICNWSPLSEKKSTHSVKVRWRYSVFSVCLMTYWTPCIHLILLSLTHSLFPIHSSGQTIRRGTVRSLSITKVLQKQCSQQKALDFFDHFPSDPDGSWRFCVGRVRKVPLTIRNMRCRKDYSNPEAISDKIFRDTSGRIWRVGRVKRNVMHSTLCESQPAKFSSAWILQDPQRYS